MRYAYHLLFLIFASGLSACNAGNDAKEPLPHIVLVMADDMGYGDPTVYNPDSKIPTPHIDRLAAEGLRLTDAHSPSAVCTPTRYGLLTGRYAWRSRLKNGVLWGYSTSLLDSATVTIPALLKTKGYATAGIGKWHLGLGAGDSTDYAQPLRPGPVDFGFDHYFGIPASLDMEPYVYFENDRVVEAPTALVEASAHRRQQGGGFWRAGPIAPGFRHEDVLDALADRSVAYLEGRAAAPEDPFFLYIPLSAPHTPWLPTEAFRGKSGAGYYGDFAVQVDHVLGRILDTLDRLDLSENTLVIFTSDNGAHWYSDDVERFGHAANGPWRGQKADIWEGGHRVPFVVRWPGKIPSGAVSDETTTHTDVMATLAAVTGATVPPGAGEDSFDMLPVWLGPPPPHPIRPATVHHSIDGMFAVREGPWKYIEGQGSGGFTEPARIDAGPGEPDGQLYNLEEDPGEQTNRYADQPERVEKLKTLLDRLRSEPKG